MYFQPTCEPAIQGRIRSPFRLLSSYSVISYRFEAEGSDAGFSLKLYTPDPTSNVT